MLKSMEKKRIDMITLLIQKGADLNTQINSSLNQKQTPLTMLIKSGTTHEDTLLHLTSLFIQAGADINATDGRGFTPLMHAALTPNSKLLQTLLKVDNIDIDQQSDTGHTALMVAVSQSKMPIIEYLLSRGANVHLRTHTEKESALSLAIKKDDEAICAQLLQKGATFTEEEFNSAKPGPVLDILTKQH